MIALYKQRRGHMRIYCVSAQIIGWMLLIIPCIVFITKFLGHVRFDDYRPYTILLTILYIILFMLQAVFSNFMLPGIVLVGIALFIRYLNDEEYQPDWFLRHGSVVLNICAVIMLIVYVCGLLQRFNYIAGMNAAGFSRLSSDWVLNALPSIGIVLILVGAGQVFRRLMPIIEESRMLTKLGTNIGARLQKTVTDPNNIENFKSLPSGRKKYALAAIIIAGLLTLGTLCYIWLRMANRADSFYLRALQTGKLIGPVSLPKGHFPPSSDKQNYNVTEPAESELEVRKRLLRPSVTITMTDVPLNEPVEAILAAYFGNEAPPVRIDVADDSKMPRISIDARNMPLYEVLCNIASQANVYISIENRTIILREKVPDIVKDAI